MESDHKYLKSRLLRGDFRPMKRFFTQPRADFFFPETAAKVIKLFGFRRSACLTPSRFMRVHRELSGEQKNDENFPLSRD
jgi:hypothetical protein